MSNRFAVPLMRCKLSVSSLAVAGVLVALSAGAVAQSVESGKSDDASSSSAEQLVAAVDNLTESSSSEAMSPVSASGTGAAQPDRPYSPYGSRNRGWMNHATFEIGGGFNGPSRGSSRAITWGGNVTAGAGYKFSQHFSVLTEYQFIADKLPGAVISQTGANGGNAHIWSLTLAPVIDLFPRAKNSLYVTGGGGFYRKVTSFTDPQVVQYCNYYYCGIGVVNQVIGHYSSNQGGWNVGLGYTRKIGGGFGDESKAKLFAEARYLDIDTPAVDSQPNGLGRTTVAAGTRLIPVTIGVRF